MGAGQYRHTIEIQEPTASADGLGGGGTETWSTVSGMGSVRASIKPLKSAERLESMKLEHEITHLIGIRYRPGVSAKMRAVFGSRVFNFISVINVNERSKKLEIMATEVD